MDEVLLRLATKGLFPPGAVWFALQLLMDAERSQLVADRAAVLDDEERREQRDRRLAAVNARRRFPAGSMLMATEEGRPAWRPSLIAVTERDLIVLDDRPGGELEEIQRIPLAEMAGVRLLDEHGHAVIRPPTEVEELDARERRYVVWVDRRTDEGEAGHAFAFLSWSPAAEAERRFRVELPAAAK